MPEVVEVLSQRVRVAMRPGADRAADLIIASTPATMSFRLQAHPSRLQVGLLLPQRARPVDVSCDPSVVLGAVAPPGSARDDLAVVSGWLQDFSSAHGLFSVASPDLARALTGASFPLLARLYEQGAGTLPRVPRWAEPALVAPTASIAVRGVLGPLATRVVVAALAASLMPASGGDLPPQVYPLALALMARDVLAPDAMARVVSVAASGPLVEPAELPTVDDIRLVQVVTRWLGPRRVERMLSDAGTHPGGARLLVETSRLLVGLPSGAWRRLPARLDALHERCVELTPIDPRPPDAQAVPTPSAAATRTPRRAPGSRPAPRVELPRQALVAPASAGPGPSIGAAFGYPASVTRLHRRAVSPRLRLVLPRTPIELRSWGHILHSCIGSFAEAVASGVSLLVGVERDDVLRYCAELTPRTRTIRQFHASHNRSVPHETAAAVVRVLAGADLLDARHPLNRPWIDLCRSEN